MDTKIIEQIKKDEPVLKADLTYLADRIGPRLTGSAQLDRASHWTEEQFKAAGFANAHLESWSIANSWTREPATGRIVAPAEQNLTLASGGWSSSTNGVVRGSVVGVSYHTAADLEQYHGKLKGAIVLMGAPREMELPENPMITPLGRRSDSGGASEKRSAVHQQRLQEAPRGDDDADRDREGRSPCCIGSEKEYGLMNMSSPLSRQYAPAAAPTAYVERENYLQMWRLLEHGPVEVGSESSAANCSGKPVDVYNTVAEIRGQRKA